MAIAMATTLAPAKTPTAVGAQVSRSNTPAHALRSTEGYSFMPFDASMAPKGSTAIAKENGTRADVKSLDFTLAFKVYGALSLNDPQTNKPLSVGTKYYSAFEMSETNRAAYAGNKITSVNIISPINKTLSNNQGKYVNDITDVTVFLTHGLDEEPFYTQNGELGTDGYTLYKIQLDTPYEIKADEPLYIGYYAKIKSASDYYIVVDGVARESLEGGYVGYAKDSGDTRWGNVAEYYGNLCIGATIEGENLPENGVSTYSLELPTYVEPGQPFSFKIGFLGATYNAAQSVDIEYTIGDQAPETLNIPFEEKDYLDFNEIAVYSINNAVCNETGSAILFNVKITKVNGQPNGSTDNKASGDFQCFDKNLGFTHRYVVEEGTGTWCPWCPQGIVMMEFLKEKYPDQFIRVAVHGDDKMTVNSTSSVLKLFSGFPSAFVDRTYDCMLGYTDVDVNAELTKYYEANKDIPAIADVDLNVNFVPGTKNVNIPTTVKFAADAANADRYRLAYYVIENNVGPYNQQNNYAGGRYGEMGGWEDKPSQVSMMYEDVARNLVGTVSGLEGSLPGTIKAGQTYDYTGTASIGNVANDEFIVVAMVIDSNTLRILNAKQMTAYKSAGVENMAGETASVKVRGGNGMVHIEGAYAEAAVYSVSGQLMATPTGEAAIELPAGVYVVVVDSVAVKALVN